ncbi:hypothetical protein [Paraflavitalea speifideaquila]|nr:hypothetical protein [Paraflavitalea speifideiaquila]
MRQVAGFANRKQYKPAFRLHLSSPSLLLLYGSFTVALLLTWT